MVEQRKVYSIRKMKTPLTQGTIISNCLCDEFQCKRVWGCVITPRCDLAHDKVKTVHYLPVINYEEWIRQYARPVLLEQWRKELLGQIKSALKGSRLNDGVIDTLRLLSKEDLLGLGEEFLKSNIDKFKVNVEDYYSEVPSKRFKEYVNGEKIISGFLNKFTGYANNHYYIIESWDKQDASPFKVILLREIRRMKYNIAAKISEGFLRENFKDEELTDSDLCISDDEIYISEADILSPYIEHILQHFSNNFTRIGVVDFERQEIEKMKEIMKENL